MDPEWGVSLKDSVDFGGSAEISGEGLLAENLSRADRNEQFAIRLDFLFIKHDSLLL